MTVSEIRKLMLERVIPESVLPQNIAAYLSDSDYIPPELDAFTFLNRLRSLGIGSADFLYLLKGCGAPDEAVNKIEQRPDMNLQSLIMTLDGSGLTPKDYTRMLYTARQLWEHTITMRIDIDEEQPEQEQQSEKPVKPEKSAESERVLTARQKRHSEETVYTPEDKPDKPEKPARIKTARQKKKEEPEFREYVGVKPIGKRNQPEEAPDSPAEEPQITRDNPPVHTSVQQKRRPEEIPYDPDNLSDLGDSDDISEPEYQRGHGRFAVAAIGAVILCALSAAADHMGFKPEENSSAAVRFAEDRSEIFTEIRAAYLAENIGGGNVQSAPDNARAFGDLLVTPDGGLGVFSSGSTVWAVEQEIITEYTVSGSGAEITAEIAPPEGARFLTVFQTENGIAAVFTGESSCGFYGIGSNGQSFLTEQSGALTDYYCSGDILRLGSVYTPAFTRSFTVDDVLEYLPYTGKDGSLTAADPSDIAVNGKAAGCSYAVWGEFSLRSGEAVSIKAALGDPIYSGAEQFAAALREETGTMIIASGEDGSLVCEEINQIVAAACGGGIIAAAEQTEEGITVFLRDKALKPISGFKTGAEITALRIKDNVIYVRNGDKTVMAADVSTPETPAPMELTAASGVIRGEFALCGGKTASGISLTLFRIKDGKAVQADSYAKALTPAELESFRFCGANTMVINGGEQCGAAYRYFDGVTMVDEFVELGKSRSVKTMFDDTDGFTAAAVVDGELTLICGERLY